MIARRVRELGGCWRALRGAINRWQALALGAWTALLAVAFVVTWRTVPINLTAVTLFGGLLGSSLSARWMRVKTNGLGMSVDACFLVYCLEMALLGPTLTALSAIIENALYPHPRHAVRWANMLNLGTVGLLGGVALRALEPAGAHACSSLSSGCGSYLTGAFAVFVTFLALNFFGVWAVQFIPEQASCPVPWRSGRGILASFALSLPLLGVILVAWAHVGAIALVVVTILAFGFMWLLHRMYTAEHLADELQEMAGHLDAERLYRVLVGNLPDIGVALVSPELQVVAVHGGAGPAALTEEAVGCRLDALPFLNGALLAEAAGHCRAALAGERRSFEVEHADRIFDVTLAPVYDDTAKVSGALAVVHEVTERRMFERRIAHQATHDALTGLPNRAAFMDALGAAAGGPMTVMMIDVDKFKAVNDSFGHETGDELLRVIAQRLQSAVRADDLAARLAGDEFAVLLGAPSSVEEAASVAQRIASVANTPVQIGALAFRPRISVGVAIAQTDAEPERLLHEADIAMYHAKSDSDSLYRIYEPSLGHIPGAHRSFERA